MFLFRNWCAWHGLSRVNVNRPSIDRLSHENAHPPSRSCLICSLIGKVTQSGMSACTQAEVGLVGGGQSLNYDTEHDRLLLTGLNSTGAFTVHERRYILSHTHTHIHIHVYTYAYIHIYIYIRKQINIHVRTRRHVSICIISRTHVHTRTHALTHTYTWILLCIHICKCTHTDIHSPTTCEHTRKEAPLKSSYVLTSHE